MIEQKVHTNLPHIDITGHYQFVTFRTYESIDDYLKKFDLKFDEAPKRQYRIDRYLDTSPKGAYLNGEILEITKDFLIQKNGEVYELVSFCVMPNHVHILFKQKDELARTMRILKGGSARLINQKLGRTGKFWENDYYDKAIRNQHHFQITYEYIRNNPLKAGLDLERFYSVFE